jgi:formylmethanofuran dehydrogenase subunit C
VDKILLKPKGEIGIMIEAEVINPNVFAGKSQEDIEQLLVWQGPDQLPISEFFDIEVTATDGSEETFIIIHGDVTRVKHIGHRMRTGKIEIHGSAGMHVGSEMMGGVAFSWKVT